MSNSKPKGLGRGLSALMASVEPNVADSLDTQPILSFAEQNIPIHKIHPKVILHLSQ